MADGRILSQGELALIGEPARPVPPAREVRGAGGVGGRKYAVELGEQRLEKTVEATGDWYEYKSPS